MPVTLISDCDICEEDVDNCDDILLKVVCGNCYKELDREREKLEAKVEILRKELRKLKKTKGVK